MMQGEMNNKINRVPKIIVAHPGKQHSLKLAEALEKEGMLVAYITTMYNKRGTITYALTHILSGQERKKASNRKSEKIKEEHIVVRAEVIGLLGRLFARLFHSQRMYIYWNDFLNRSFAKKVAKYVIRNSVDAVISFDNDSDLLFEILKQKAPDVKRILDVSIANRLFLKDVYEMNMKRKSCEGLQKEQFNLWRTSTQKRLRKELDLSQYFLAASETVIRSLEYSHISRELIYKVPYGVDIHKFSYVHHAKPHSPIKLIYVGNVSYRKGCHYLLDVVAKMGCEKVCLQLVGGYVAELYEKYKEYENIKFVGFLTHDLLVEKYQQSDVFVLPSLGEGMAMVGLEAQACGLPMICTDMTGVNDIVKNGENGFVIPAGDENELEKKIKWFIENPEKISEMSEKSREIAEKYTWENYYQQVSNSVLNICMTDISD